MKAMSGEARAAESRKSSKFEFWNTGRVETESSTGTVYNQIRGKAGSTDNILFAQSNGNQLKDDKFNFEETKETEVDDNIIGTSYKKNSKSSNTIHMRNYQIQDDYIAPNLRASSTLVKDGIGVGRSEADIFQRRATLSQYIPGKRRHSFSNSKALGQTFNPDIKNEARPNMFGKLQNFFFKKNNDSPKLAKKTITKANQHQAYMNKLHRMAEASPDKDLVNYARQKSGLPFDEDESMKFGR